MAKMKSYYDPENKEGYAEYHRQYRIKKKELQRIEKEILSIISEPNFFINNLSNPEIMAEVEELLLLRAQLKERK